VTHGALLTLLFSVLSAQPAQPAQRGPTPARAIEPLLSREQLGLEAPALGEPNVKPIVLQSSTSKPRAWGVVKLSIGQTGLGMGTVTGTLAGTRIFAGDRFCPAGHCTLGTPAPDDGSALRDLRTITPAGYALGAAGISTWLGLLVSTPTRAASADQPHVSAWTPIVGLGSAGARYIF
jgi:hypothetical protein